AQQSGSQPVRKGATSATEPKCSDGGHAGPKGSSTYPWSMIFSENRYPLFGIMLWNARPARERIMSFRKRHRGDLASPESVAGNGLLDRRALLGRGLVLAGAMGTGVGTSVTGAAAEPLKDDPWSLEMGSPVPAYQVPSRFEKNVVRTLSNP